MTGKALLRLEERQLISNDKLVRKLVVKRRGGMRQVWSRVRDVVVRRREAPNGRTACKQLRVHIEQFRKGIAGLELQAMPHVLLDIEDERVVVATDAV